MKKKVTLLTIALIYLVNVKAQEIKTFKGDLKGGTQTFAYYENDKGDLIKNGKYNYIKKEKGLNYNITGQFKNGKREGLWKFDITYTNWGENSTSLLGYKRMTMSYLKGLPNGICKYSSALQIRNAKYINGRKQWGQYDKKTISNLTFNFKNGILVGKFNINDGIAKEKASGSFNENSFANGNFITQDDFMHSKTSATYKNGIIIAFNKVDLTSGKSEYNLKNDPLLFNLSNELANNKIKSSELPKTDKNFYTTDTVHTIAPIKTSLKTFIYQDDFLFYEIGGDLNYNNGEIKYGGNRAVMIAKYNYQTLGRPFSIANQSFDSKRYQSALEDYQSILYAKKYLSESDKNILLNKIKICKEKIVELDILMKKEKAKKLKQQKEIYDNLIINANDFFDNEKFLESSKLYRKASKMTTEYGLNTDLALKRLEESMTLAEEKKKKDAKELKDAKIKLIQLYNSSESKEKEIKNLYVVEDRIKSQITGVKEYKYKKKNLYKAYLLLIEDNKKKFRNIKDLSTVMNVENTINSIQDLNIITIMTSILNENIEIYNKMNLYFSIKTKDLEKSLKNETNVLTIKELILK